MGFPSITMEGEEKSHVAPIWSRTGFPRFIEFASPFITINVSKYKVIDLDVSENDNGNFSFPLFVSVDPSAEVMLMLVLLRVTALGIVPDFFSLLKNAVLITGTLRVFPESIHAFKPMPLIDRAIQFAEDVLLSGFTSQSCDSSCMLSI